jgi:hypothetical protein
MLNPWRTQAQRKGPTQKRWIGRSEGDVNHSPEALNKTPNAQRPTFNSEEVDRPPSLTSDLWYLTSDL